MAKCLTRHRTSAEIPLPPRLLGWAGCALLLALSALPVAAQARIETLHWTHPSPADVEGFRVHYGTTSRGYDTVVDIGSTYSYDLAVPDGRAIYVALSAYAGGLESALSNELVLTDDGSAGSTWSDDFEASALGSFVPDWLDTDSGNRFDERDTLFGIAELGGNRVLRTRSTLGDIHSHHIGSESWSSYEVRARVRVTSAAVRIGITSHSQYPFEDAYYSLSTDEETGELALAGHPEPWPPSGVACSSPTTGVVAEANRWYRVALRVAVGDIRTDLHGKVWQDDGPEPAAWQAHCWHHDASLPSAGGVGVWSSGAGTKYWDDLEVSFVPAPTPGPRLFGAVAALGLVARKRRFSSERR